MVFHRNKKMITERKKTLKKTRCQRKSRRKVNYQNGRFQKNQKDRSKLNETLKNVQGLQECVKKRKIQSI